MKFKFIINKGLSDMRWNMIERLEYPRTEICEFLKSGVHGLEVRPVGEVDYLKDVKVREVFSYTNS